MCLFCCLFFFFVVVVTVIEISKLALPGVMLKFEIERKKETKVQEKVWLGELNVST